MISENKIVATIVNNQRNYEKKIFDWFQNRSYAKNLDYEYSFEDNYLQTDFVKDIEYRSHEFYYGFWDSAKIKLILPNITSTIINIDSHIELNRHEDYLDFLFNFRIENLHPENFRPHITIKRDQAFVGDLQAYYDESLKNALKTIAENEHFLTVSGTIYIEDFHKKADLEH